MFFLHSIIALRFGLKMRNEEVFYILSQLAFIVRGRVAVPLFDVLYFFAFTNMEQSVIGSVFSLLFSAFIWCSLSCPLADLVVLLLYELSGRIVHLFLCALWQ